MYAKLNKKSLAKFFVKIIRQIHVSILLLFHNQMSEAKVLMYLSINWELIFDLIILLNFIKIRLTKLNYFIAILKKYFGFKY